MAPEQGCVLRKNQQAIQTDTWQGKNHYTSCVDALDLALPQLPPTSGAPGKGHHPSKSGVATHPRTSADGSFLVRALAITAAQMPSIRQSQSTGIDISPLLSLSSYYNDYLALSPLLFGFALSARRRVRPLPSPLRLFNCLNIIATRNLEVVTVLHGLELVDAKALLFVVRDISCNNHCWRKGGVLVVGELVGLL